MVVTEFIKKRKRGEEHTESELLEFVSGFVSGKIPDYQVAAWLMATNFNELSLPTTAALTRIMRDSGDKIAFPSGEKVVDKHSTGGVGDKTTMIIGPVVAACGVKMASLAGRGLGHTGGTVDKLESIAGYNTQVSPEDFVKFVLDTGICIAGQTESICPADKKLYALRDVTATVSSISLISASILSKKLAEGTCALVLDVKFGSGAFMKTLEDAKKLALTLKEIGELNNVKINAFLTDMNQPLGRYAGNSLEMKECIEILKNKKLIYSGVDYYEDTRELSLRLSADLIFLGGGAESIEDAYAKACQSIEDGSAYKKFLEMLRNQGAKDDSLPVAKFSHQVKAKKSGVVSEIDTEAIGMACVSLKAGREQKSDQLDLASGLEWHFKLNHNINEGDVLFTLYAEDESYFKETEEKLLCAIRIGSDKAKQHNLIEEVIR